MRAHDHRKELKEMRAELGDMRLVMIDRRYNNIDSQLGHEIFDFLPPPRGGGLGWVGEKPNFSVQVQK